MSLLGPKTAGLTVALVCGAVLLLAAPTTGTASGAAPATTAHSDATASAGPGPQYRCSFNVNTAAFTGAYGTASAIGWLADHNSVITCLGGTFVVQDGPVGYFTDYSASPISRPPTASGRASRSMPTAPPSA